MKRVSQNREHNLKAAQKKEHDQLMKTIAEKPSAPKCAQLRPKSARKSESTSLFSKPQRPITARSDMRRGFTFTPRRLAPSESASNPGPAAYLPSRPGTIGLKVGQGKDTDPGKVVHDALCWAGSSFTSPAAPFSTKIFVASDQLGSDSPGPAYEIPRFGDKVFHTSDQKTCFIQSARTYK